MDLLEGALVRGSPQGGDLGVKARVCARSGVPVHGVAQRRVDPAAGEPAAGAAAAVACDATDDGWRLL